MKTAEHQIVTIDLTTGFSLKKGKKKVLQSDINAVLNRGELVCLLGPNGAGKSTLMRTLTGFHAPLKGDILYNGTPLSEIRVKELAAMVSVVLTNRPERFMLTVFEVVAMGCYPRLPLSGKLPREEVNNIRTALGQVQMEAFSQRIFSELSDGEKQKVLLATALVQQTPFIFLDEPAAFIDAPGKIAILELLKQISHTQNKGILLSTHDVETAVNHADKVWLLGNDKPFVQGVPEDIVLNGLLTGYFKQDDIGFDPVKGKFVKHKPVPEKKIYISGESVEAVWLQKALERNDYLVLKTNRNNMANGIAVENGRFVIIKRNKPEIVCNNIGEVLNCLKQ